mmetsp:Transcript_115235/g.229575  ORF Transcript_115235/g.229575 Transcript_115235/m.229575 type:complete len:362 (-) Transcript_115235:101-1186(-)
MWIIGACQLPFLAVAATATNTASGALAASHGHGGAPPIPSSGVPLLHVRWQSDDVATSDEFLQKLEQACRGSADGRQRLACEATETPRVYCSLIHQFRQRQPGNHSLRSHPAPGNHDKSALAATSATPPDTGGNISNSTAPEVLVAAASPFTACLRFAIDVGSPDEKTPFVRCLEQAAEEDGCSNRGDNFARNVSIEGIQDHERRGGTVYADAGTELDDNSTRSMLPQKQSQHAEPRRIALASQRLRGQPSGNNANGGDSTDLKQGPPESVLAAKALHAAAAVAAAISAGQASTEAMSAAEAATAALATSNAAASASSQALSMAKGAVAQVSEIRAHMKAAAQAKAAALRKLEGDAPGFFG